MSTPRWFPDEIARAGSEHLDPAYVPGYDRKANTDPADDIALLREQGLNDRHIVVDLGAGDRGDAYDMGGIAGDWRRRGRRKTCPRVMTPNVARKTGACRASLRVWSRYAVRRTRRPV